MKHVVWNLDRGVNRHLRCPSLRLFRHEWRMSCHCQARAGARTSIHRNQLWSTRSCHVFQIVKMEHFRFPSFWCDWWMSSLLTLCGASSTLSLTISTWPHPCVAFRRSLEIWHCINLHDRLAPQFLPCGTPTWQHMEIEKKQNDDNPQWRTKVAKPSDCQHVSSSIQTIQRMWFIRRKQFGDQSQQHQKQQQQQQQMHPNRRATTIPAARAALATAAATMMTAATWSVVTAVMSKIWTMNWQPRRHRRTMKMRMMTMTMTMMTSWWRKLPRNHGTLLFPDASTHEQRFVGKKETVWQREANQQQSSSTPVLDLGNLLPDASTQEQKCSGKQEMTTTHTTPRNSLLVSNNTSASPNQQNLKLSLAWTSTNGWRMENGTTVSSCWVRMWSRTNMETPWWTPFASVVVTLVERKKITPRMKLRFASVSMHTNCCGCRPARFMFPRGSSRGVGPTGWSHLFFWRSPSAEVVPLQHQPVRPAKRASEPSPRTDPEVHLRWGIWQCLCDDNIHHDGDIHHFANASSFCHFCAQLHCRLAPTCISHCLLPFFVQHFVENQHQTTQSLKLSFDIRRSWEREWQSMKTTLKCLFFFPLCCFQNIQNNFNSNGVK